MGFFDAMPILKLILYCLWCYTGIKYLKLNFNYPKLMAVIFGVLRMLLGISLILVFLIGSYIFYPIQNIFLRGIFIYLFIAIPLRWFEWSVMEFIMNRKARKSNFLTQTPGLQSLKWRLGGIVLCALLDLPIILFSHAGNSIFNVEMC